MRLWPQLFILADLGAGSQTYSSERNAACRYYSGRSCDSRSPANSLLRQSKSWLKPPYSDNMIDR
jgi:hypothetical protein